MHIVNDEDATPAQLARSCLIILCTTKVIGACSEQGKLLLADAMEKLAQFHQHEDPEWFPRFIGQDECSTPTT